MIYRILLSSLTILTLATCESQKVVNTEKTKASEKNEVITKSEPRTTPQQSTPKTSTDLPVNKKDVKVSNQGTGKQTISNKKGMIYLKEGENKFLKEYDMNVTFKRIAEDSRCPKEVQCIWAGNAIAEVEFMGTYTRPVTLQLSTMNDKSKGYANTQTFNGYSITLENVTPETTSAKGFKSLKGSYQIALKFEKDNGANSTTERGGTTTK